MDRFEADGETREKDAQPLLFLSLFLLLLALFILLNAVAQREDIKSRAVIGSLTSTFSSADRSTSSAELLISTLGNSPTPEEMIAAIEQLWVSAIRVTRVEVHAPGRTMQLVLPANELFVGGSTDMRADRQDLAIATAQALAAQPAGHVNELQFVLGVGETGRSAPSEETLRQIGRAATIARELVANGAPADTLTVGLLRGDPKLLRLRFFVHAAVSAPTASGQEVP